MARLSDWWHGWRDGRRGVPLARPGRGRVTTPHRDVLIRRARESFEHEYLCLEVTRAASLEIVASASARLAGAEERLQAARSELAAVPAALTDIALAQRRLGEDARPPAVTARRRIREHGRHRAPLVAAVDARAAERDACAAQLAAATDAAKRDLAVAEARVRRVHEHAHRRLASYDRRLVRTHPRGTELEWELDPAIPHLPGWASGPAPAPESTAEPAPPAPPKGHRVVPIGAVTEIGSDPRADVRLDGGQVAAWHACLRRTADGVELRNRGRGGETFVAGRAVQRVVLALGDGFVIGNWWLRIRTVDELEIGPLRPPSLIVSELSATTKGTTRLDTMSFSQREGTVLAILGPSGAGKSSLFAALLGELAPGDGGSLFFDGLNLRQNGAQIRSMLGFVPQDDSLHRSLTVGSLLTFSDRLRMPHRRSDRKDRITTVCADLDIRPELLAKRVDKLSGGQRKRVSVAMELLADPRLLMLDEPTSGLDAGMDREVMALLRRMAEGRTGTAREARTVVVVTHSTDNLHLAHQVLLLAPHGRPVHFGDHRKIPHKLGCANYADLMKALIYEKERTRGWVVQYREGPQAQQAKDDAQRAAAAVPVAQDVPDGRRRSPGPLLRQLGVLFTRQWALLLARAPVRGADSVLKGAWGAVVVVMPLLIGAIGAAVAAVVTVDGALHLGPSAAATALNLLVTLGMLAGQALTYSDVVSEFDVIKREHRTGASPAAVVLAKWAVFATIVVAQAGVIALAYVFFRGAPERSLVLGPTAELFVNLAALGVATMSLGLLISVLARKLEQAVLISTGAAIAQVAFNGWTADLSSNGIQHWVSALLPARWGFAANAASIDLRSLAPTAPADQLWRHAVDQWWTNHLWLAGLTVAYVLGAILLLRLAVQPPKAARPASSRATGTRNGEHET